ncbi:MAG: hypothetical protein KJ880_00260 [Candidatus Omnitrophica bacterium]|nr:hypothetical protein [Candidatus Omnitrophota bacterium]MBU1870451.1 hypothetical protein [Candidatus Omnitrophota bacterium]
MSYQHKSLAEGRWRELSFIEQMANIGSEIERALNWKAKHNDVYCQQAFERSLELIDLTLGSVKGFARLKELARLREAIVDYFLGTNEFKFSEESLKKYFLNFIYAARKNH